MSIDLNLYDTKFGKYLLNPNDNISKHLIKNTFWEEELLPIFDRYINKNSTIIEIGSYIGDHTVYLSKICKKVYAFEGFKRNYYQLLTNLLLNDCWNVEPINLVIGNNTFVKEPTKENEDPWPIDFEDNASGARYILGETQCKAVSLDSLYFDSSIDLLKIDAEGMDLDIMMGAKNLIENNKPVIIFEYNGLISEYPLEDYIEYLVSFGYTVDRVGEYNWLAIRKEY